VNAGLAFLLFGFCDDIFAAHSVERGDGSAHRVEHVIALYLSCNVEGESRLVNAALLVEILHAFEKGRHYSIYIFVCRGSRCLRVCSTFAHCGGVGEGERRGARVVAKRFLRSSNFTKSVENSFATRMTSNGRQLELQNSI